MMCAFDKTLYYYYFFVVVDVVSKAIGKEN